MTEDQAWGLVILIISVAILVNPGAKTESVAGAVLGCLGALLGAFGVLLGIALLTQGTSA